MQKTISYLFQYLILIYFLSIFNITAIAQPPDLEQKITIVAKDTLLQSVLEEISRKGNIHFAFSNEQVFIHHKVSVYANNESIRSVLDNLCKELYLEYQIVEKQVILKPSRKFYKQLESYTINGYMKDKETGEILIGATVWVKELATGTSTNKYGFYSLTLPEGFYTLEYSYMGYNPIEQTIALKSNQQNHINLSLKTLLLKEIIIEASKQDETVKTRTGEIKLSAQTIKQMPGFLGESELIKSLQTIPGIKTYGDGSVFFYVRGGNKDHNLLLIDDAPLYNPSHLLGFFSSFTPDAIKDIQIYKGDIPASHGGMLASLIDIRTKDGNMKSYSAYGSIGPVASRLSLEGPVIKDKSSFFISARRSYLGWLFPKEVRKDFQLYFFDINTKLNYQLNTNNRLYFTLYSGKDLYNNSYNSPTTFGLNWGNNIATLRWNHLFNDKLFSNTTLLTSKYDYYLYTSVEDKQYWNETISNIGCKSDFTYFINPENTLKFGADVHWYFFNPGNMELNKENVFIPKIPQQKTRQMVVYTENNQKAGEKLWLRYGLRFSMWQNTGATDVYIFDNYQLTDTIHTGKGEVYNTYTNIEPRISITYLLNKNSSFKASYSRTSQYIQLLSNSISPFTSLEVWLPSGPNIQPQKAEQTALGYEKEIFLKKHKVQFSLDGYYKKMYAQVDYRDHPNMLLNPLIEGELRFGKAWSYGLECLLNQ